MIINNKKEFEKFFPYDKSNIKEYPKEYPCVCKIETIDGGLRGEFYELYVMNFPIKNRLLENTFLCGFLCGLTAKWRLLYKG